MLQDKAKGGTKRRESSAGFHFVNLYQCCPRKFYIRYVKGWSPKKTPGPLVQGSAFHEGKAAWYAQKSEKKAIATAMGVLEESKRELDDDAVYNEISFRIPHFLHYWIERFGRSDLQEYKVIGIEKALRIPIDGTPYEMTIRADVVLRNKQSRLTFVFETKTSGFSHRLTSEAVYYGDQATAYIWGVRKTIAPDVYGCIPDIAYWNSRSRDIGNMQFLRTDIVTRSDYALDMFEEGMARTFTEINQKILACKAGVDERIMFPRNSYYCLSYSKVCEFAGVCQQNLKGLKRPCDLKSDRKIKSIGGLVDDSIAIQ